MMTSSECRVIIYLNARSTYTPWVIRVGKLNTHNLLFKGWIPKQLKHITCSTETNQEINPENNQEIKKCIAL